MVWAKILVLLLGFSFLLAVKQEREINNRGVTVYDCTSPHTQYTVLDLTSASECKEPRNDYEKVKDVNMVVVQRQTKKYIKAIQCRVELRKVVIPCGYDSITYAMQDFVSDLPFTSETCEQMYRKEVLVIGNHQMHVPRGKAKRLRYFSHGHANGKGECEVDYKFTTQGVLFEKAYEMTHVKAYSQEVKGVWDEETKLVTFPTLGGLVGSTESSIIHDAFHGTVTWKTPEESECSDLR